jgi:hypothetical protein
LLYSSAKKRSCRETKRPDQYADGCDVVIWLGSGCTSVAVVPELLLDRETRDARDNPSREVVDANKLLVEDADVLRDDGSSESREENLELSEDREMDVLRSLKTANVRDFGRRLLFF